MLMFQVKSLQLLRSEILFLSAWSIITIISEHFSKEPSCPGGSEEHKCKQSVPAVICGPAAEGCAVLAYTWGKVNSHVALSSFLAD